MDAPARNKCETYFRFKKSVLEATQNGAFMRNYGVLAMHLGEMARSSHRDVGVKPLE